MKKRIEGKKINSEILYEQGTDIWEEDARGLFYDGNARACMCDEENDPTEKGNLMMQISRSQNRHQIQN